MSTTHLLGLIGLICVLASHGSPRRNWQLMRKTLPEIHQEALARRLVGSAPWQRALFWCGFGLFVLSLWRSWSGQ